MTCPGSPRHRTAEPEPLNSRSLVFTAAHAHSIVSGWQKLQWWLGSRVLCGWDLCRPRASSLARPSRFTCGRGEGARSARLCPSPQADRDLLPGLPLPPHPMPASAAGADCPSGGSVGQLLHCEGDRQASDLRFSQCAGLPPRYISFYCTSINICRVDEYMNGKWSF